MNKRSGAEEPEYVEPSASMRRKSWTLLIAGIVAGALIQFVLAPRFFDYVNGLPVCERIPVLRALFITLLGIAPLFAIWGLWTARKVLTHSQWPAPGAWVLRRTRIWRGSAARRRAYALIVTSVLVGSIPFAGASLLAGTGLLGQPPPCAGGGTSRQ